MKPRVHSNHLADQENLYWGIDRLSSPFLRAVYRLRKQDGNSFAGHDEDSPLFWGDLCKANISYVRNFVFDEINLSRLPGPLPYFDPDRPYVSGWFSSSEGGNVREFARLLTRRNIDRLAEDGTTTSPVMYTHFAVGFWDGRDLDARFVASMRYLTSLRGWFVPVSELLDRLQRGRVQISQRERTRLERRWRHYKAIRGTS